MSFDTASISAKLSSLLSEELASFVELVDFGEDDEAPDLTECWSTDEADMKKGC